MIYFNFFNNHDFLIKYKKIKIKINKNKVNNFFIISNNIPDKLIIKNNDILSSLLCPPKKIVLKYTGILAELYFLKMENLSDNEYYKSIHKIEKLYQLEYKSFLQNNRKEIFNKINYISSKNREELFLYFSSNEMPFNFFDIIKDFLTFERIG